MLVTVIAQFTAKVTNLEKAIYFLSIMSCSINKSSFKCSLHVKILCFPILLGKKIYSRKWRGTGATLPHPPFPYSPVLLHLFKKGILHFFHAILVYLQGALRKKQLIDSLSEHFKEKSWKHLKLIFQSHISRFRIFHTLFYWISIWIYRKRVIDQKNSPREILEKILIVLIRLIFLL